MKYKIYTNTRDSSWKFLIQHKISCLPINLKQITSEMEITVKKDTSGILRESESGRAVNANGDLHIIVRESPVPQKRYTIMHEIGHIVLGHTEKDIVSDINEYAAERFAIDVLAPACVLWGLNIHSAEEIAEICNISLSAARIRAARMEMLYKRDKFLTSSLERQVFKQFYDFISTRRIFSFSDKENFRR